MVPFLRGQPAWSFPWRRVLAGLEGEGHLIAVDLVDYCGDANIGRRLYPLMIESGLTKVRVSPRLVYVDASRPALAEGFTRRTFIAMIEGVRERALQAGLIEPKQFNTGLRDLRRTTGEGGVFCYTFFKAVGENADEAR